MRDLIIFKWYGCNEAEKERLFVDTVFDLICLKYESLRFVTINFVEITYPYIM